MEVTYPFYRDTYGGALGPEAFAEATPAATRLLRHLTGAAEPDADSWDAADLLAWSRALCAATDAFAEFGEGRVGGYSVGSFKVTNYMERGTTGWEVASQAAEAELQGTGLLFSGVA